MHAFSLHVIFLNQFQVFAKHKDITFHNVQEFLCFQYVGRVDDDFPKITFHFENDLPLNVYPHDYFFENGVM
jgi:hypothetical protein